MTYVDAREVSTHFFMLDKHTPNKNERAIHSGFILRPERKLRTISFHFPAIFYFKQREIHFPRAVISCNSSVEVGLFRRREKLQ